MLRVCLQDMNERTILWNYFLKKNDKISITSKINLAIQNWKKIAENENFHLQSMWTCKWNKPCTSQESSIIYWYIRVLQRN